MFHSNAAQEYSEYILRHAHDSLSLKRAKELLMSAFEAGRDYQRSIDAQYFLKRDELEGID